MKIHTIQAGILAAVFAGAAMAAGAQTMTTVVNSATPGDRTVEHTTMGPDGKASTTATTITKAKGTRNEQITHTGPNGKTTTRDTVTTRDAQTGTEQKLVVNGPKSGKAVHTANVHKKKQPAQGADTTATASTAK